MTKNSIFTKAIEKIVIEEKGLRKGVGALTKQKTKLKDLCEIYKHKILLLKAQARKNHEFEQYIREEYPKIYWEVVKSSKVVQAVKEKKKVSK